MLASRPLQERAGVAWLNNRASVHNNFGPETGTLQCSTRVCRHWKQQGTSTALTVAVYSCCGMTAGATQPVWSGL